MARVYGPLRGRLPRYAPESVCPLHLGPGVAALLGDGDGFGEVKNEKHTAMSSRPATMPMACVALIPSFLSFLSLSSLGATPSANGKCGMALDWERVCSQARAPTRERALHYRTAQAASPACSSQGHSIQEKITGINPKPYYKKARSDSQSHGAQDHKPSLHPRHAFHHATLFLHSLPVEPWHSNHPWQPHHS